MASGASKSEKIRGAFRHWLRHYTRGTLLLLLLIAVVSLGVSVLHAERAASIWAWVSVGSDRLALALAAIVIVPLLLSWFAEAVVQPMLRRRREFGALLAFERNLVTELAPDEESPVAVVLVNWPSAEIKSVGVLTSEFSDPETGEEFASVLILNGPKLSRGTVRVVRRDSIQPTDWTLREFMAHQWSFGAAVPRQDEP